MKYILRAWSQSASGKCETKYYEFEELELAKTSADTLVQVYKHLGKEYDIAIYEITNY